MIAIAYTLLFCFLGAQMICWLMPRKSPLVRAWLGVSLGVLMEMGLPALCANALDFTVAAHIAAVAAALLLAAALAWLFAESVLQARPIPALTKALRTVLPLAVLAGVCYNFCVYFAAEPQLMGQNPALYENVSRLVQFWL